MTAAETLAHLLRCGVGERTAEVIASGRLDEARQAMQAIKTFVAGQDVTLTLLGRTGCGKTVAAATALLASRVKFGDPPQEAYDGAGARFVFVDDICRMPYFEAATHNRIRSLSQIQWLVLDDLGSEMLTDPWLSSLYNLIQARHERSTRTVITSNLEPAAFSAKYGARIVDRLKNTGPIIVCEPDSLRGRVR